MDLNSKSELKPHITLTSPAWPRKWFPNRDQLTQYKSCSWSWLSGRIHRIKQIQNESGKLFSIFKGRWSACLFASRFVQINKYVLVQLVIYLSGAQRVIWNRENSHLENRTLLRATHGKLQQSNFHLGIQNTSTKLQKHVFKTDATRHSVPIHEFALLFGVIYSNKALPKWTLNN